MKTSWFTIATTAFCLLSCAFLSAQEVTSIQADIRKMSKETDPLNCIRIKEQIMAEYHLDSLKDAETIDLLNGSIAVAFAMEKNFPAFEQYIKLIQNKFNQTSMLCMAANKLLDSEVDADYACKLARETLEIYYTMKEDPSARPEDFAREDWERFMDFAKYPYYDTYAKALFAVGKYPEAIQYQEIAFDGKPEEGLPSAVERYAKLLELTGDAEKAKKLLLTLAQMGKLNQGMIAQLEAFFVAERGSNANFSGYLDSLQTGVQAGIIAELRKNMGNEVAPPFALKDIQGNLVRLADYRGKIVILDLWATWCAPCIASFPAMQQLTEKYPEVVFLFIAVDEKGNNALERVQKFIAKNKYPFLVLMDEPLDKTSDKYLITSSYQPNGIPAKYFIDTNGNLRFRSKGFDTDAELINEIEAMITILKGL
ncbi:MAG: TlpA family protein disulfide reductase [Lewinellaceae bacterium]|nr:TlpA family protein disulfide reductase [Lewinellaceae bacterium]